MFKQFKAQAEAISHPERTHRKNSQSEYQRDVYFAGVIN